MEAVKMGTVALIVLCLGPIGQKGGLARLHKGKPPA